MPENERAFLIADNDPIIPPNVDLVEKDISPVEISVHTATATIPSSMINILNTILGSGMLAMPNAFASLGVLLGALAVLVFGTFSALGLYLLTLCGKQVPGRNASFNSVSKITYPHAAIAFDLAIAIKCFGVACSYLVIIGNLMPRIAVDLFGVTSDSWWYAHTVWISLFMIVITPLSFLRRLDSLKYTSTVALGAVVYLVFLSIFFYAGGTQDRVPVDSDKIHLINPQWTFLKKLPVFVFAFTCHQNIFAVQNELRYNSQTRLNAVSFGSIGISCLTYWIVAVMGYLAFGDDVPENMLLAFPPSHYVTVARVTITILVTFSFPLQCHPCRASLEKVIGAVKDNYYSRNPQPAQYQPINNSEPRGLYQKTMALFTPTEVHTSKLELDKTFRHIFLTLSIIVLSYIISFFVVDLGLVLNLVGSTGSTTICYILPGVFYLKLTQGEPWTVLRVAALMMMCSGFIIMPVCVAFNFISI